MASYNEYTLGRGRLYVDRFNNNGDSTGWRYLGNTPSLGVTKDTQVLDHFDSDSGVKVKDKSVTLQEDMNLTFETDNVDETNVALWFGGTTSNSNVASATAQTFSFTAVRGMTYSIGENLGTGAEGKHNLTSATVAVGAGAGTPLAAGEYADNVIIDLVGGMITVMKDAPDIAEGANVTVTYAVGAFTEKRTIDAGKTVYGRIKFVSDNPVGPNRTFTWPYCKLSPNGDMALKGDDWQKLSFTAEVLKQNVDSNRFVIRSVPNNNA